jgi:hypothetical protein
MRHLEMPPRRKHSVESRLERISQERDNVIHSMKEENQRVNPDVARRHAIAAANLAYRHNQYTNVDQGHLRTDIPAALRKTRSVRFSGPYANQSPGRSITRRVAPNWDDLQRGRKSTDGAFNKKHSMDGITALPKFSDAKVDTKSSYRKIRKTRSMLSPRKQYGDFFTNATPVRQPLRGHHATHSHLSGTTAVAETSFSGETKVAEDILLQMPNPYLLNHDQDVVIRLAQEEYRRQVVEQANSTGRSELHRLNSSVTTDGAIESPRLKPQRSFRKTTRKTSGNQYGASVGSQPVGTMCKDKTIGHKARKISSTLRSKFKKAFGKKMDKAMPSQQVESQRLHFGSDSGNLSDVEELFDSFVPMPNKELLHRISSRDSFGNTPYPQREESQRSFNAIASEIDSDRDESRVTSWATSTMTNETAQTADHKRLTVIEENSDAYRPSKSVNVGQTTVRNKYDAFKKPRPPGRINQPVDTQDIYAALQKKLDEAKALHRDEKKVTGTRKSSWNLRRMSSDMPRAESDGHLHDDGDNSSVRSRTYASSVTTYPGVEAADSDDVFRPLPNPDLKTKRSSILLKKGLTSRRSSIGFNGKAGRDERKILRETRSSFLPRQLSLKIAGMSPHKHSSRTSTKKDLKHASKIASENLRGLSPDSNDSDSIYSRRTTGTPSGIETRLDLSGSHFELGTAVPGDSQVFARRYSDLLVDGAGLGPVPSTSKDVDWKSWMASQVASLEGITEEDSHLAAFNVTKKAL